MTCFSRQKKKKQTGRGEGEPIVRQLRVSRSSRWLAGSQPRTRRTIPHRRGVLLCWKHNHLVRECIVQVETHPLKEWGRTRRFTGSRRTFQDAQRLLFCFFHHLAAMVLPQYYLTKVNRLQELRARRSNERWRVVFQRNRNDIIRSFH